jgi:hypothetical protein
MSPLEQDSWLRLLTDAQRRAFRAQAWRHVRRINPIRARLAWLRARDRA